MEATADGLDVPNPWSAPSAALITAERRKPVRDCAWHKEALDARLYQFGAKFLAGSAATN